MDPKNDQSPLGSSKEELSEVMDILKVPGPGPISSYQIKKTFSFKNSNFPQQLRTF